jgi:hypothetical protein
METTVTLTAAEIAAILHLVSYNARLRDAGYDKALLPVPAEATAFDKLLHAGHTVDVDVYQYT